MKRIIVIILLALTIFNLFGCVQLTSAPVASNQTVEPIETIEIDKAFISIGAHYDISQDGTEIGEVTGEFMPIFGDTFIYTDIDGNVIAKEYEQKRLFNLSFNRQADIKDANDELTGYIGEEITNDFFNVGYTFHFYDKDMNEVAYTRQVALSLLGEQDIFNLRGEVIAKVNREFSVFTKQYTILIYQDELSKSDLIFFACIIDAIQSAEEADRAREDNED